MLTRGCSIDDKNYQMIWYCSILKCISSHAIGFYYGNQIRKISTSQNRRKILFFILKTKKMANVVKGLSDVCIKVDAHTKDDACMSYMTMWHEVEIIVAL